MDDTRDEGQGEERGETGLITVREDTAGRRFELVEAETETVVGATHWIPFDGSDGAERVFYHTTVDEAYGGRGLASMLVRQAMDRTAEDGLAVAPVCPYVKKWLENHPDHPVRRQKVRPAHLEALRG